MQGRPWDRGRGEGSPVRVALAVIAALGAILLFLLASASANTALFAANYPWLLAINGAAAVALLVLVGLQLRRLRRDFKSGVFGSRLKSRLLLMLSLMAVLPGALVYGVSMQFAVKSIDSWFDVRVDKALEGGLNLGRSVLDGLQADLLAKARDAALELGDAATVSPSRLNRLREQTGAQSATLLTLSGQVLGSSSGEMGSLLPSVPAPSQLRAARGGRGLAQIGEAPSGGLMVRALAPVSGSGLNLEPRILQLTLAVPASIVKSAESVEAAHRDYQELQLGRAGLKHIYTLTLTLALLLALFSAIALAFFLAERLARPLLILAEGTQAVAAGDFTPRATVDASDELGVLTHSFNSMTQQLGEARAQAEHHRQETEATQAYLESVLANLSAGVLAFDLRFRLRAANRGAQAILGDDLGGFEQMRLQDWPRHETLAGAILGGFAGRGDEWQEQLEIARPDGMPQALLVRGTALPAAGGGGYVVVFDDITRLIAAQRSAAWGEVAQRLAHEIKNPLTPIQLSAERLKRHFADAPSGARALVDECTTTIVGEVESLKGLVDEFSQFARMPTPRTAPTDLHALITSALSLYDGIFTDVEFVPQFGDDLPLVRLDPEQVRRVIINVVDNAIEAMDRKGRIVIETAHDEPNHLVRIVIADNGPGIPPEEREKLFLPYYSTKRRGSGLGLAIVRRIIAEHGGTIDASDNEPTGTRFTIELPV